MSTAAPNDGGSNPEHLKDKLKHPFHGLREKFRDTKLYDLKVGLIHKKYVYNPEAIFEN
jgi:phospholipase D1/2